MIGRSFEADGDGSTWQAEEVAIIDGNGGLGLYAFDTARHTSATTLLSERCRLFSEEVLRKVEAEGRRAAETPPGQGSPDKGETPAGPRPTGKRPAVRRLATILETVDKKLMAI